METIGFMPVFALPALFVTPVCCCEGRGRLLPDPIRQAQAFRRRMQTKRA